MKQHIRSLLVGAAIIAALSTSTASAQPSAAPVPQPEQRICVAKDMVCIRYVKVLGRYVCVAKKMTCIKWL